MFRTLTAILLPVLLALPQPTGGGCVHDFAAMIPINLKSELEALCTYVESETTAEMAVVTVSTLQGMTVEEYANELFNSWGIGQRETNNGVLFLVAPHERRTRIEVGYGLEELLTDSRAGDIINMTIVPQFKSGNFVEGIRSGAKEISKTLLSDRTAAHGKIDSSPPYIKKLKKSHSSLALICVGVGFFLFLVSHYLRKIRDYGYIPFVIISVSLLGVVGLAIYSSLLAKIATPTLFGGIGATLISFVSNVRSFGRYRPRSCKKCRSPMVLLDETQDDKNLDEGQRMEERLKSVDYDVWLCPGCSDTTKTEHAAFLSSLKKCDKCSYRVFKTISTKTIVAATTSHAGNRELNGKCQFCKFEKTWYEAIPKISTSSSSSSSGGGGGGGGFSGGSSGGGGASGGW